MRKLFNITTRIFKLKKNNMNKGLNSPKTLQTDKGDEEKEVEKTEKEIPQNLSENDTDNDDDDKIS